LSEETEENHNKISVRAAGILMEIRSKHTRNIFLECYPCNNLVCAEKYRWNCNIGTSNATYFSYDAQTLSLERSVAFFDATFGLAAARFMFHMGIQQNFHKTAFVTRSVTM
jgi:hypothetical protein